MFELSASSADNSNIYNISGPVAHLVEHLACTEEVAGSSPVGSIYNKNMGIDTSSIEDEIRSTDWLPKGIDLKDYVEWKWDSAGEENIGLKERIGKPRIEYNIFFDSFLERIRKFKENNPEKLKFFEAGSGHGNDFRVARDLFLKEGIDVDSLGVEYSEKEIRAGLEFYKDRDKEDEAQREIYKSLAQGDLRDLKNIKFLNSETGEFDRVEEIEDGTFGVIYFEAIMHAFGMGEGSYKEKKANALKMLKELYRIAQPGAMFFGRASIFGPDDQGKILSREEQINFLRENEEWRFFPHDIEEFKQMLEEVGFEEVEMDRLIRDSKKRATRRNINRIFFCCIKPESK